MFHSELGTARHNVFFISKYWTLTSGYDDFL
jgi:hypothetical protein